MKRNEKKRKEKKRKEKKRKEKKRKEKRKAKQTPNMVMDENMLLPSPILLSGRNPQVASNDTKRCQEP